MGQGGILLSLFPCDVRVAHGGSNNSMDTRAALRGTLMSPKVRKLTTQFLQGINSAVNAQARAVSKTLNRCRELGRRMTSYFRNANSTDNSDRGKATEKPSGGAGGGIGASSRSSAALTEDAAAVGLDGLVSGIGCVAGGHETFVKISSGTVAVITTRCQNDGTSLAHGLVRVVVAVRVVGGCAVRGTDVICTG